MRMCRLLQVNYCCNCERAFGNAVATGSQIVPRLAVANQVSSQASEASLQGIIGGFGPENDSDHG